MIILNKKKNKGFVALMSAIIISVILLLMVTNLSLTGFYDRSNIFDSEMKNVSLALAEACVDTALLKLANDSTYIATGGETVTISGSDTCTIDQTTLTNPTRIFNVHASPSNYYTNLQIEINVATVGVNKWEEI